MQDKTEVDTLDITKLKTTDVLVEDYEYDTLPESVIIVVGGSEGSGCIDLSSMSSD